MKLKRLLQGMLACSLLCSLVVIQACDDDDEPKDTLAPEVTFTNITEDMTVWNTVSISLDASDDQGIDEIHVFADGNLITTLTASPFETSWDSNTVADGEHTLKVVVTDKSGNSVEKEISVNVLNTLVTINIAADQLYSETDFSERGFVFLSDENGNVIAHQEYQNGNTVVFKSSTFNGEKFFLSEALVETRPGDDLIRLWTFAQIERGKTWVVIDDREEDDDEIYAGEANLNFTNLNVNSTYYAASNGDAATADEFNTQEVIRIRNNSKLYVIRDINDEDNAPVAYNLYPSVVVGNNTINLSLVNKPLTKVTISLPSDSEYSSTRITGYPVANTFTDPYSIGYHASGTDILTYDIYYPGTAFPAYYTETDYETPTVYYNRASTSQTFSLQQITNDIDFTFAANKLTYSATGDFDFFSTQFSGGDDGPYWSFILPEGTNQIIPAIKLPTELSSFTMPDFGLPPHYTVYAFDEITDYDGLKNFIRSSTGSVDALYDKGKNYVDIVYKNPVFGGRAKQSGFVKAFGKIRKR